MRVMLAGAAWVGASLLLEVIALVLLYCGVGTAGLVAAASAHVAAAGCGSWAAMPRFGGAHASHASALSTGTWFLGLLLPGLAPLLALALPRTSVAHYSDDQTEPSVQCRREAAAAKAALVRRNETSVGVDVVPLVDALRDPDKDVRIAAVEMLQGNSSGKAVALLSRSRFNTVVDVRVRAAEGLGDIARDHLLRISRAKEMAQLTHTAADFLHLARVCLEYVKLGIESKSMAKRYAKVAAFAAAQAEQRGGGGEALRLWGESLRELGFHLAAEQVYQEVLGKEVTNLDAALALADVQFRRRDYVALRATCAWVLAHHREQLEEDMTATLEFWAGDAQGSTGDAAA